MSGAVAWPGPHDVVLQAWLGAVQRAHWHAPVLAAAYATAGLWCLALRRCARGWLAPGMALMALAVLTLFSLDQLTVLVARELAHAQGWYAGRRGWQGAALACLALLGWAASTRIVPRLAEADPVARWVAAGVSLAAAVAVLRLVSLHASDALLQARLWGVTAGRAAEALGLALVFTGLARHPRAPVR